MRWVLLFLLCYWASFLPAQHSYSARDGSLGATTWILKPDQWFTRDGAGVSADDKNYLRFGVHFPHSQVDPMRGFLEYIYLKPKFSYAVGLTHLRLASAKFSTAVSVCFSGLIGENLSLTLFSEWLHVYQFQPKATYSIPIMTVAAYRFSAGFRLALRWDQRIEKLDSHTFSEPPKLWIGASKRIGKNMSMNWALGKAKARGYEMGTGLEICQFPFENLTLRFGCQGFDHLSLGLGLGWEIGNVDLAATVKLHPTLGHSTLSDITYGW